MAFLRTPELYCEKLVLDHFVRIIIVVMFLRDTEVDNFDDIVRLFFAQSIKSDTKSGFTNEIERQDYEPVIKINLTKGVSSHCNMVQLMYLRLLQWLLFDGISGS